MAAPVSAHARRPGIVLPRRNRRYRFSMTPLADVMFQLLIFFMLTSHITSYSLLDIRAGGVIGATAGTQDRQGTDIRRTVIWTLQENGAIQVSGQRFAPDRLDALAGALEAQGTTDVLILLRDEVPVQRLVTVLQTLAALDGVTVTVAEGGF
ncbi:ExbD/TolR family protein [Paracoccus jeotgali]|uniref:Biopolymer transporter ExbD n=1 Tax=Paracoccus jeotgali TaxID=2065379 RepID=A0A2K9MDQ4_9RHOB|nr:biopolymer transporter ExbD [Paracoccus jeotgali]AUM73734.1 hypothetical protein CYR75_05055 [Paracoccus jeotgali]